MEVFLFRLEANIDSFEISVDHYCTIVKPRGEEHYVYIYHYYGDAYLRAFYGDEGIKCTPDQYNRLLKLLPQV